MKNTIIAIVLTAVVVGAGAFYGGIKYNQAKGGAGAPGQRQFQFSQNGTRGIRMGGNFAGGQVIAVDQNSVTVKSRDGSSRIVFVNPSVVVAKSVSGSVADIKSGDDIIVQGTVNADGSVTAQAIQIRPMMPSPTQ